MPELLSKTCSGCAEVRPLDEFHRTTRTKSGRVGRCKTCKNKTNRRWRVRVSHQRPEVEHRKKRAQDLGKFGLTLEQYDHLLTAQDGVCAICRQPEQKRHQNGRINSLAVDHCHETGRVRGLLCNRCNRGLGLLGERADLLEAALRYLNGADHTLVPPGRSR